jgi:predicted pyridoxine 5'-phosphate oxidase superfamily flavin-nucleotide-binding protein
MSIYHDGQRKLQDQFDTRRMANMLEMNMVKDALDPKQRAFIESADMFFLATADSQRRPSCTYRGGDPGPAGGNFVRCIDERTLIVPNYDGNGMYVSWGNAIDNPNVGLLFIDFMKGWRLRIHGIASIDEHDPLMSNYPEAQFIVRIAVREAFGNCPRYIHKYQLVERSSYVPRKGCATPVPDWKKKADVRDVLPRDDPAREL